MKKFLGFRMQNILTIFSLAILVNFIYGEGKKEEVLGKIIEKYRNIDTVSGEMEIGMFMLGNEMKISSTFWKKEKKFRMEGTIMKPGMDSPMEQLIICDGKKMWQYIKGANTVTTIDFSQFPDEVKNKIEKQQAFGGIDKNLPEEILKTIDKINFTEKTENEKNFYVLEIKDFGEIVKNLPVEVKHKIQIFKKLVILVDPSTYYITKIELYGEAEKPGVWIEFKNLKFGQIPDNLFSFEVPKDAYVIDITDMMIKMTETMAKSSEVIQKDTEIKKKE